MNFTYENNGNNTYLMYEFLKDDVEDTVNIGMLTNNNIKGLAPAIFTQIDLTKYVKYNISAKIPVKQYFEGIVTKKKLINIFLGIIDAIITSEEYMIPITSILLDLNYIFVDVSTDEILVICIPIISDNEVDLNMFFKNIMFSTQFDQMENCDYVAKIINYLNNKVAFSLNDFRKIIVELKDGEKKVEQKPVQSVPVQPQLQNAMPNTAPVVAPPVGNNAGQYSQNPTSFATPKNAYVENKNINPVAKPQIPAIPGEQKANDKKGGFFSKLMHGKKDNTSASKKKPDKGSSKNADFAIPGQKVTVNDYNYSNNKANNTNVNNINMNNNIPNVPKKVNPVVMPTPVVNQSVPVQPFSNNMQSVPNFGETTVLNNMDSSETTVLGAVNNVANKKEPYLLRTKNNERVILTKPRFRMGREKSYVDYCIVDNNAVGRSHADIIVKLDGCFIMDMNSKNHTYVNGNLIQSGTEIKLEHNDKILLANEEFEFKLY